ncbi:hydroxyacid dehydrogenase [Streptomyces odontomachi]|uniref:hydroxyacid dehydrogenase n=1 Tax=Streptomyces odontomachi TaxID=2944940 RepID=UPI002109C559|nr:hydroxyacid dehydrogenase [Streptomyces sp. ODS25]
MTPAGTHAPADVVIAEDVWGTAFEELARTHHVVRLPQGTGSGDETLREALAGARALVVRNRTEVTADLLAAAPHLKIVARAGVGLDNIDVDAADAAGVVVTAGLGANATSVAEHTLALALSLLRDVIKHDRATRKGIWRRTPGRELAGKTWGILGVGATGLAVARLLAAFGVQVWGYDPYADPQSERIRASGVRLATLDEVVAGADILSVHLPATPETRHLLDADLLARTRPGALLINVGRGEVIDEKALMAALESGHLAGAGLDVRGTEPPELSRLEWLETVILTPHVAGITAESQERIVGMLAEDIAAVLSGQAASHAVGRLRDTPRDTPVEVAS